MERARSQRPPARDSAGTAPAERRHIERRRVDVLRAKALDVTVRALAHDLNNALGIVMTQADLLELEQDPDARARRIETIHAAVRHGAVLVERLRQLDEEVVAPGPCDPNAVVSATSDLVLATAPTTVSHRVVLDATAVAATIAHQDLAFVVTNLLTNAVDAMPDGGYVSVRTHDVIIAEQTPEGPAPGRYVAVTVVDTGHGIDRAALARILEGRGRSARGVGHGIGLALARLLVHEQGGRIEARSARGVGSTFTALVPVVGTAGPSSAAGDAGPTDAAEVAVDGAAPHRAYWVVRDRMPAELRHGARRAVDAVGGAVAGSVVGVHLDHPEPGELPVELPVGLTFDDGPDPETTPRLLALLGTLGVTATFFVLVEPAEARPELVRAILDAGHDVGLHGLDHRRVSTLDRSGAQVWLRDGRDRLARLGIPVPRLFRPPFGAQSLTSYRAAVALGLTTVLWSADAEDWVDDDAGAIAARGVARLDPGGILLLHERAAPAVGAPAPTLHFDPVDVARLTVEGLCDRGLHPMSIGALLTGRRARRSVWFRP